MRRWLVSALVVALATAACTPSDDDQVTTSPPATTTATTATVADPGFYLNLMWHQHQPFYPRDDDGVYTRPWVRLHATKDYYDMVALVADYPEIQVTFNLTPVLLLQLEDLATGAEDSYWVHTEIPADELTPEQFAFVTERFFDVNPRIVARFPRFEELAGVRALRRFTVEEIRDLQVLFNLAWTDPDFLAVEPLASLVAKGEGYSEADKQTVLSEHRRILAEVIPLHAEMWEAGQIEVTTTPLAHPILPLIGDTALASVGDPTAFLPENRFREVRDAEAQIVRGLDVAERLLGRRPTGMWPGEGSVAQLVMWLFSENGVSWVASGEEVLGKTLGVSFERTADDLVEQADRLYRPYSAQILRRDPVAMFFRDGVLSDLIGFEYSGTPADQAADDFMRRLRAIHDALDADGRLGGERPPVVSVILDGENAWEYYDNDGKDFLRALYGRLSGAGWVETITPSAYLERYGEPQPVEDVWPGAWFQPNFATWIGEQEESDAWDYLFQVRQDLKAAKPDVSAIRYEAAFEKMLFAEGSDWFWWYGTDQDSGNDAYFDTAFRELLGQVYDELGVERPPFVGVPIIPERPIVADQAVSDLMTPLIDGLYSAAEWGAGGTLALPGTTFDALHWGFDREHLYLFAERPGGAVETGAVYPLYLGLPQGAESAVTAGGVPLGYGATHVVIITSKGACLSAAAVHVSDPDSDCVAVQSAWGSDGLEVSIPLGELGPLDTGDLVLFKLDDPTTGLVPEAGPIGAQLPDISNVEVILEVDDPTGDDHGPGTYTYPTDAVFIPGSYDLERFTVGTEGVDMVIDLEVAAPIQNPWGSPRGLSVQTFDIYIDADPGENTGSRILIPGRNGALAPGNGWEYGITVEGWDPAVYVAAEDGTVEETKPSFDVVVFGDRGRVVVRLPLTLLGDGDPATWGYAAAVMSQEGFPSPGVRRIRDVEPTAQQWRIGGSPGGINATRILDVALATLGEQERLLSDFSPVSEGTVDDLGPDGFGTIGLLMP